MHRAFPALLATCLSCAAGDQASTRAVAESPAQGTLPLEMPDPPVRLVGGMVESYGMTEVRANARLQMAKVAARSAALSELSRFLGGRVESAMRDYQDEERTRAIELWTKEVSSRTLAGAEQASYGWQVVGSRLRVIARVPIPLAELRGALERSVDREIVDGIMRSLEEAAEQR